MKIGWIHACIAGDFRYSTSVDVYLDDNSNILIERLENGAVGGMDGPGGATESQASYQKKILAKNVSPAVVVKETKKAFDHIINRYGTPSKNFKWVTGEKGISAAKVKKALSR